MAGVSTRRADAFAREQKRRWFAEGRRWTKGLRHGVRKWAVETGRQWAKSWTGRRVRWAHRAALWWPKIRRLRRPVQFLFVRGRNLALATVNLTRKAGRRMWAWRKPVMRTRARVRRTADLFAAYREEWRVERDLEAAVDRGRPIVIGPWLSEVGFETLYWVPFVRWVKATYHLRPEQLLVISRGGVAGWYADITPNYLEIFDHLAPASFAAANQERADATGSIKQHALSPLELELVELGRRRLGADRVEVLHPSLMYRLFRQFWAGHRPLGFMETHTRFGRVSAPPLADLRAVGLPERYVAAKFYAAQSLPDTPENRALLRHLVAAIAERLPVVLLDTGLSLDDHDDYLFGATDRIISARDLFEPRQNLGIQTQIIAGSEGFVGTCGSLAWLAPMLGVPTTGVFTDDRYLNVHVHAARRAYRQFDAGQFAVLDVGGLASLDLVVSARGMVPA